MLWVYRDVKSRTMSKALKFARYKNFIKAQMLTKSFDQAKLKSAGNAGVLVTPIDNTTRLTNDSGVPFHPLLHGNLTINITEAEAAYAKLMTEFSNVKDRGSIDIFETRRGIHDLTVAVIIPIRNRPAHLRLLLGHLIPILQRQLRRFQIFTAYQFGDGTFNKGRLMNAAFRYLLDATRVEDVKFDCFIFHDVDMLTESDLNTYECFPGTNKVKHMSYTVNKFNYTFCCGMTVGGVLSFTEEQFIKVNGFSNHFWGWGGEDDDMNARIKENKLEVVRPHLSVGRYTMIPHDRDKLNPYNAKVLKQLGRRQRSNFNGLAGCPAQVLGVEVRPLFVNILIKVEED
uniref:Beta-1,4-galactosyltransferase n=2 Tax=Ciona intestinalis TaxID=7719 RepID=H2XNF7_CIOIN